MNGILPELTDRFRDLGSVAVCFSGGLDSTVLLANAMAAVPEGTLAVMADLPMLSRSQRLHATAVAEYLGIKPFVVKIGWNDLDGVRMNGSDRCYHCKTAIYRAVSRIADGRGIANIVAGDNADDDPADRPGMRAGEEFGIIRPLRELGIGRDTVIACIAEMNLPVEMVKSTCLATRFPEGRPIGEKEMRSAERIEQRIEKLTGVRQLRVRFGSEKAVVLSGPEETDLLLKNKDAIADILAGEGYAEMSIDREGYRGR
jgi:uncharacterized protein